MMEDNNVLNETYQKTKNELQSEIAQLEGKLKEQSKVEESLKSELERLKAEITENNDFKIRHKEELSKSEALRKEEVHRSVIMEEIRLIACFINYPIGYFSSVILMIFFVLNVNDVISLKASEQQLLEKRQN